MLDAQPSIAVTAFGSDACMVGGIGSNLHHRHQRQRSG